MRLYTPSRTVAWEGRASVVFRDSWGAREALDEPVRLSVVALFPRPKRMMWKTRPMPRVPFASRPDASNVLKAVEDALEKAGCYRDDKLIWSSSIEAFYCSGSETPLVRACIEW